jgi:hypothetical protein
VRQRISAFERAVRARRKVVTLVTVPAVLLGVNAPPATGLVQTSPTSR